MASMLPLSTEEQLKKLKIEVEMLEDDLHNSAQQSVHINNEQLENIIKHLIKSQSKVTPKQKRSLDEMTGDINSLNQEIDMLSIFSGVQIENTTCQVTKIESTAVERQHTISGNCSRKPFQLDFTIRETKEAENENQARVHDLHISVNKAAATDLASALERLEEDCDVQGFFRVFVPYVEWNGHRQRALQHFQQKYAPDVVLPHGPGGNHMMLASKKHPGAVWSIEWLILVTPGGRVYPRLELIVKSSKEMLELDKNHILESAPEKFQKMIHLLGINRAIESIAQIILK